MPLEEELRVPEIGLDVGSTVPIVQLGARARTSPTLSTTSYSANISTTDADNILVYFLPGSITASLVNRGTTESVVVGTTTLTVTGNSVVATGAVSTTWSRATAPVVVEFDYTNNVVTGYNGYTGATLSTHNVTITAPTNITPGMTFPSTDRKAFMDVITRIRIEDSGTYMNWYGGSPFYIFTNDPIIPMDMKVIRGKDSQRQLTPPRVPYMTAKIWDKGGELYRSREYESGDPVSALGMLAGGVVRCVFTGLVDKVGYNFEEGELFTYSVSGLGLSSKLNDEKISTEVLGRGGSFTIRDAIVKTLAEVGISTNMYFLPTGDFSNILEWWWVGDELGNAVLNKLINSELPPAIYWEDQYGIIRFASSNANIRRDAYVLGDNVHNMNSNSNDGGIPVIGPIDERSEHKYVVNRAELLYIDYNETTPDDEGNYENIWNRTSPFTIEASDGTNHGVYDLFASFAGPITKYALNSNGVELPDFESTFANNTSADTTVAYIDQNATSAHIRFTNPHTETVQVQNVRIQGLKLEQVGQQLFNTEDVEKASTVMESQEAHGIRDWPANAYNTIADTQKLVNNIVQNYHEEVDTFVLKLYGNKYNHLMRLLQFDDNISVTHDVNSVNNASQISTFVRKFEHSWSQGFFYTVIEVESKTAEFFGVGAFILGTTQLDSGAGYSG